MRRKYLIYRMFFAFTIALFFCLPLLAQDDIPLDELRQKAIEKFIDQKEKREFRFTGQKEIPAGEEYDGNFIVENGNLEISGTIYGDVLVIFGNVSVKSTGFVDGNVTAINGKIYQSKKARVSGAQIETNVKNLFRPERWKNEMYQKFEAHYDRMYCDDLGSYSTLPLGFRELSFLLRYNRIEGPFIGLELPKMIGGKYTIFNLYGFGGYGFGQNAWQYKVGLNRWLFSQTRNRFEIGGEIYDYNDTKDDWYITPIENSLAAFFIHEDFQEFYRLKGYRIYTSLNFTIYLKASLSYSDHNYESIEKHVDWALFGGKKKFDDNPPVNEGKMRSVYGSLYIDTRDNKNKPRAGWYLLLSGETSNTGLDSDFSFNQYNLDLRRYQRISRYEQLDIRLMAGTAQGALPFQKSYDMGGIGTIRAAGFKHIRSQRKNADDVIIGYDRMLLANFEYTVNHRIFHSGLSLLNYLNYLLIFDMGNAWHRDEFDEEDSWYKGFSHLQWRDMISSFGIGITSWSGRVRFTVSRRTDTGKDPVRITLRLRKPF